MIICVCWAQTNFITKLLTFMWKTLALFVWWSLLDTPELQGQTYDSNLALDYSKLSKNRD